MITWLKHHPAESAVAVLSFAALSSSIHLLHLQTQFRASVRVPSFHVAGEDLLGTPDSTPLDQALEAIQAPSQWTPHPQRGRLFASKPYVGVAGKLERPEGRVFHPPVPNDWLLEHGLDPLSPSVLTEDPDRDGFSNLLEWNHGTPTNPTQAQSHPPYHTRLVLEKIERIPFQLRFETYDVGVGGKITVQINPQHGRSEYVGVGEPLKYSPFTVTGFTEKTAPQPDGTTKDFSEVTVRDHRTNRTVTLPFRQNVDSPESYAILRYDWSAPASNASAPRFRQRPGDNFILPPTGESYRLKAILSDTVELGLPDGTSHTLRVAQKVRN
jgi:hypothetical protein